MEILCHLQICKQKSFFLNRLISTRLKLYRQSLHYSVPTFKSEPTWKKCIFYQQKKHLSHPTSFLSTRFYFAKTGINGHQGFILNGLHKKTMICFNHFYHNGNVPPALPVANVFASAQTHIQSIRPIHTSARLNVLLPPHVWLLLKPAQKLFAIILGRSVRKWWRALPANKQELFKENVKRNKWKLVLSVGALGIIFILFYSTHLEESPITGRSRLLLFRKEHYDLLTKVEYESLIEEFKDIMLPEKDPRYQLVQRIVDHLIACNGDLPGTSEIEWVVHVVDRPDINAFVLPNGQVFVFTGMLEAVADTHQLSFILGHEMAHALLEHTAEMASVSHFLDFLFLISLAMIWALCPLDSLAIFSQWIQSKLKEFMFDRPYSRTLEAEADRVGLQLAAKACVDVRASSVFWKQMEISETVGGLPRIPEWLSTHPSHENRAEHLDRLIPEAIKLRESCNCPSLPFPDPRLIFNLSVKHLLQTPREMEHSMKRGDLSPIQLDDKVQLAPVVKAI